MTAPPASRQNVAVRSRRCSSGCWRDLGIRPAFDGGSRTPPARRSRRRAREHLEVLAALAERAVLVVGGAGGREQDHLAGLRGGARRGDRVLEVAAVPGGR